MTLFQVLALSSAARVPGPMDRLVPRALRFRNLHSIRGVFRNVQTHGDSLWGDELWRISAGPL